ncbi:hypothetical protein QQG55_39570 [Brugia pahangi]
MCIGIGKSPESYVLQFCFPEDLSRRLKSQKYKVLEVESRKPEYTVQEPSMHVGSGNMTLHNGENEIFQFVEYVLINKQSNAFLTVGWSGIVHMGVVDI